MKKLTVILVNGALAFFNPIYGESFVSSLSISDRIAPSEVYIDPRDNNKYEYVTIGNQSWMTSNLRYDTPRRCNGLETFCKGENGNYYSIEGAFEAIPPGWRLPTKEDYKLMFKNLGVEYDSIDFDERYRVLFGKLEDPINLYSKRPFYHRDIKFWYVGDLRTQYYWTSSSWYCPFQSTYENRSGISWYRFGYNCVDETMAIDMWGNEDDFLKVRCVKDL